MAVINKSAIVPYSAAQMYDLVNGVAEYSEFLPYCTASTVLSEDKDQMRAALTLAFHGIEKQFTTCNRLQKNKMIEVRLEEGPFHHLEGFWRFETLEAQACKIELDMEFEIAGFIMSKMFGPIFHQVANKLVDSFVERAKVKYTSNKSNEN